MGVRSRTPILDACRPWFHAACRAYFGLEFRGVENIPRGGPLVIAPNHQTYADPPLVTIPVRRPVHYMAWDRLFTIPAFGWWIRRLRAFPVRVDERDMRATREAIRLLQAGEVVMIFPEAGRSTDGLMQPFKPGAFRLAVAVKAPVLPVAISGGTASWPPGRRLPRPGRITITYHPAVRPDVSRDARAAARDLGDRAWAAIAATLAQSRPGEPGDRPAAGRSGSA
jgi:1-acyl-sn-glycerol-3-phosphate acyltransferase